jgi:hypothetical protein
MEQRRLRLGDILDDYCPRERRVTNHAVVAMIEEDVKQTRCTTCDAEHAYKGARVPKRRKKETPAGLYKEVLAGLTEGDGEPAVNAAPTDAAPPEPPLPIVATVVEELPVRANEDEPELPARREIPGILRQRLVEPEPDVPAPLEAIEPQTDPLDPPEGVPVVDGPVHRPLIRATLPRPEGQKDARPVPEFTIRQSPARGNGHGNGQGHGHGHGNGFRGERMRMRSNGNGTGHGQGNGQGASHGNRPHGGPRFHGGSGNRPQGAGRNQMGRGGPSSGFRNGNGNSNGKRGRGSRG